MLEETILIADDNKDVGSALVQLAGILGYQAIHVPDGRAALEYFGRLGEKVSLLLTDIDMPGMDGYNLVWQIREQGYANPIVMMTGRDGSPQVDGIPLLTKPFGVAEFLDMLRKTLPARVI